METGKPLDSFDGEDFSSVTAQYLLKKMKEDKKVVAITSATPTVMGFTEDKRKEAGKQFIDVGIAEENSNGNGGRDCSRWWKTGLWSIFNICTENLRPDHTGSVHR